ncbi:hypothetical protein LEM8419_01807 [Neolewinella maritima]|uniref:Gluconate 2-dehydrogenase subunit 3 family protein n=1 Tax=Neolewinella maritima TaxID=1383882 RepID=A0ABN8F8P5_9BACT|nr:gluconate 2-dehydrogenase subunit 3 family protein [Neolewinella maritima]CAH1000673.1 hypothetical protein LEM8419_01807 [Neolewinella maritima]
MMNRRALLRQASWLAGATLTAPTLVGLLQSCAREDPLDWEPQYFTPDEARFVTAYVDTLLPRTDTPGGLDVNVHVFIDRVMGVNSPAGDTPSPMQAGILEFDDGARTKYGKAFYELDESQRGELFIAAENLAPRYQPQVWGTAVGEQPPVGFYRSLKSMAQWAYLSSETIGTEVLNYDPVPGAYNGCIPLDSVGGRSWSL